MKTTKTVELKKRVANLSVGVLVGVLALSVNAKDDKIEAKVESKKEENTAKAPLAPKFAVVDMQKAIQATDIGKKAKKDLEADFNAKKKKLEQREKDLKALQEELEKKAMVLSEDARDKKRKEFQEKMMEYQKSMSESQSEIQKKERELTQPIVDRILRTVDEISKKEDYTMVFTKNEQGVLWAKKEADLTDRVVEAVNKAK